MLPSSEAITAPPQSTVTSRNVPKHSASRRLATIGGAPASASACASLDIAAAALGIEIARSTAHAMQPNSSDDG